MRVIHDDLAAAYVFDPPRSIAQQEDVSGITLDGKILIQRSHHRPAFIVSDNSISGYFWNRPAAGDRRQPGAVTGAQPAVDPVAMQIRSPTPTLGSDPLAQHFEYFLVFRLGQVPIRICSPAKLKEGVLIPALASDGGND